MWKKGKRGRTWKRGALPVLRIVGTVPVILRINWRRTVIVVVVVNRKRIVILVGTVVRLSVRHVIATVHPGGTPTTRIGPRGLAQDNQQSTTTTKQSTIGTIGGRRPTSWPAAGDSRRGLAPKNRWTRRCRTVAENARLRRGLCRHDRASRGADAQYSHPYSQSRVASRRVVASSVPESTAATSTSARRFLTGGAREFATPDATADWTAQARCNQYAGPPRRLTYAAHGGGGGVRGWPDGRMAVWPYGRLAAYRSILTLSINVMDLVRLQTETIKLGYRRRINQIMHLCYAHRAHRNSFFLFQNG